LDDQYNMFFSAPPAGTLTEDFTISVTAQLGSGVASEVADRWVVDIYNRANEAWDRKGNLAGGRAISSACPTTIRIALSSIGVHFALSTKLDIPKRVHAFVRRRLARNGSRLSFSRFLFHAALPSKPRLPMSPPTLPLLP